MKNKITAVDLSTTFFSLVFYMYFFHQFIIHKKKVYKVEKKERNTEMMYKKKTFLLN